MEVVIAYVFTVNDYLQFVYCEYRIL